jgi:hypothetical protein
VSITLNACQQAASNKFFEFLFDPDPSNKEFVIQGSAGTGKTTLMRHILDLLNPKMAMVSSLTNRYFDVQEIHYTATTRKAAQVLGQVVNKPEEATTIHSLLGLRVTNDYATGKQSLMTTGSKPNVANHLIIIDEASFVTEELLNYIRRYTKGAKILYVGDPYQLLPTSDSRSAVFDESIPGAHLLTVMRNGGLIETLAHTYKSSVITGEFPHCTVDNIDVCHYDGQSFQQAVDKAYTAPNFNANSVRILAWTNQRVHAYNKYIRSELLGKPEQFTVGEYVQTNKPIMEGDKTVAQTDEVLEITRVHPPAEICGIKGRDVSMGKIMGFLPDDQNDVRAKLAELKAQKNWSTYFLIKDGFLDLRPPYACTVHKSQGSTYEQVFIDLSDIGRCFEPTDVARMLYVGISRASKQVILYGNLPYRYGSINYEPRAITA